MKYQIPEQNLERLKHEIGKLNKRAAKLNVPAIVVTVGEFIDRPIPKDEFYFGPQRFLRVYEVDVVGETPKFAGWTFVATVQHTEEGNILRKLPGCEVELKQYRECQPLCDHCKINRFRRDTFVVLHDGGSLKQVGRNCIKDFLGHASPEMLAKQAELMFGLGELCGLCEENEGYGGRRDNRVSLHEFLGHVAEFTIQKGFITGKAAMARGDGVQSTAGLAWSNMFPTREQCKKGDVLEITPAAIALATKAVDYVVEYFVDTSDLNDFQHSLLTLAKCVAIEPRNSGLAAYIIAFYLREMEQAAERQVQAKSDFFGEPKTRYRDMPVTYLTSFNLPGGMYGDRMLHKFVDANGNIFVWKTTNPVTTGDVNPINKTLALDFTVAKHTEYRGVKQTVITRCKVKA